MFWNKKTPVLDHYQFKGSVFGVSLDESLNTANSQVKFVDDSEKTGRIPVIVAKCGHYLKNNALETPGIFRVAGNSKRIRELQNVFSEGPDYGRSFNEWDQYSVHDVASLLKRYLTNMKNNEALIPSDTTDVFERVLLQHPDVVQYLKGSYSSVVDLQSNNSSTESAVVSATADTADTPNTAGTAGTAGSVNRINEPIDSINSIAIQYKDLVVTRLEQDRKYMFMYLLDLLGMFAAHSGVNLMTPCNLAAIFQPAILGQERIVDSTKADRLVVEFMRQYSDKLLELLHLDNEVSRAVDPISPLSQSPLRMHNMHHTYYYRGSMTPPRHTTGSAGTCATSDMTPAREVPRGAIGDVLDTADRTGRRSSLPWLYKLRHKQL